jgi:AraC-like DNA-binding protein
MSVPGDDVKSGATVSANGILQIAASIRSRGLDWERIARAAGLDPDRQYDSTDHVPLKCVMALYEACGLETGDDAFGIKEGYAAPIGAATVFDYVALAAPTMGQALKNWVRFQSIPANSIPIGYIEEDRYAFLCWEISDSFGPRAQFLDMIFGFAANRIQFIAQDKQIHFKADFSHKMPRNIEAFNRILGSDIRFNQPCDRLGVPLDCLSIVPPSSEPHLLQIVEQSALRELQEREERADRLFIITNQISDALKRGDASLGAVAQELGMSRRSLQRALESSGTTYRQLVDHVRKALAQRYLVDSDLQLSEIAYLLGYSELSAFSRAAKAWFGMSANAYRKNSARR